MELRNATRGNVEPICSERLRLTVEAGIGADAPGAEKLSLGVSHSASLSSSQRFVCVAELDRFAALRSRIGYEAANTVMNACAARISAVAPGCGLGRVGRTSVEFAFVAERGLAETVLKQVVASVERPYDLAGVKLELGVTVGAIDAGDRPIDDYLLDAAAAALRHAQERHQKLTVLAADLQQPGGLDDLSLIRDLRLALETGGLALHYQPKLRSRTETIDSAEALLRWDHPTLGPVRIDRLIDLAEATGAIRDLTTWGVDQALADQQALASEGNDLTIFVNISGVLLPDTGFADWALSRLGAYPGSIGFEITETAVIDDPDVAIANLQRFAAAGIKIAIDDYGSGLSSLAYLKQLPAHELKIDRMFVKGLTETQRDPLLVRSSIDLAHALEMEVTAEGVDDQMSLSLLRVMGCDLMQGFLISHPLPLDALRTFLAENRHRSTLDAAASALAAWNTARA